jgi:hypothetical protein
MSDLVPVNEAVQEAAIWYAAHRDECPRPIIPTMREKFGLSAKQAVDALTQANRLRGGAE